jgi:putative glycosyltransferase (TIGR04372 family)
LRFSREISLIRGEPLLLVALPVSLIFLLVIFFIRPLIKVRIGFLRSDRIGHFAANTELYLCERDVNQHSHNRPLDLFYFPRKPCNQQLACMWARELIVLPWFFLRPLDLIIRSFSYLSSFHAFEARGGDRDIDNLFNKFPPHLQFRAEEEVHGEDGLRAMGIPKGAPFVCLTVRDSAYLNSIYSADVFEYHKFRDSDVQNFVLAAEELAERGFFVIRMGAKVNAAINSAHPKVIDYAINGMRSDFMDIYLGAKCAFCISVGTGYDAVTTIFRRPIVYVNYSPVGYCFTFVNSSLLLAKHHLDADSKRELTLSEIFARSVGFCMQTSDYLTNGVDLIENTPEEIRDVVIEMAERLEGTWQAHPDGESLQQRFWEIFPTDAVNNNGVPLHGEIRSRFGADFLRNNKEWLS